ncbi:PD-(D/E)XK nuclease family protein [Thermosulfidibacter takaii]|uniref:PD-(D/E)XK nuclease family protein n=1 Tax=Thermosulfidibacter takaii TaxID=412593 RepID=UPI000838E6F5|nr:PD-(D/E)XK nuclease family protein [Thermosulfidibacter takaii]
MESVICVHPKINLLEKVARDIIEAGHLSDALVIFPHRRAASFLRYYLAGMVSGVFLAPEMYAFEDWARYVFAQNREVIPKVLDVHDQAWLAYLATVEVYEDKKREVPTWDRFFGWALRLVDLFKDFDLELKTPKDIVYPPETLPEKAQSLLSRLGRIYDAYRKYLNEGNYITPSGMLRELAEGGFELEDRPIYVVGFFALTEAEDRIFRYLWEKGAKFYWHADMDNLPEPLFRWQKSWGAKVEFVCPKETKDSEIYFYEAADLHSELAKLRELLGDNVPAQPNKKAIVLMQQDNLIPLLFQLPDGPVNITMGYPLKQTGLFAFLKTLFEFVSSFDEQKGYRVKDLIALLGYQHLSDFSSLRKILLDHGAPYLTYEEIRNIGGALTEDLFNTIVFPLQRSHNIKQFTSALLSVLEFLSLKTTNVEKEFMASIVESVISPLANSLFSTVGMDFKSMARIFEQFASGVSLPFEGEPLKGLQVLGLLETRLLSFEEVFLLDVNEDVVPGIEEINPLAPQKMRTALGLPDRYRQETIVRYHFERLIDASQRVHILWQSRTTGAKGVGLEGKKVRSRFVEKLVWERERKEGRLCEGIVQQVAYNIILQSAPDDFLPKTENVKVSIKRSLLGQVSPSLLQTYLSCPLMFYYQYILKIKPKKLKEEIPFDELGNVVHACLYQYFNALCGGRFPCEVGKDDIKAEDFFKLFRDLLQRSSFFEKLSKQKRWLLWEGASFRLKNYFEKLPPYWRILGLEQELQGSLYIEDLGKIMLVGRVDRIDERRNHVVIVDYKTGKSKEVKISRFKKLELGDLKNYGREELKVVADTLTEIQLPFYVYLYGLSQKERDYSEITACYVNLENNGEETFLVGEKNMPSEELKHWITECFPELLRYLINHMFYAPYWYPANDDRTCSFCDFKGFCRYTFA